MTESFIRLERDGAIASLTIDRVDRRNAITNEMMADLERLGREFSQDEQTRAVIVRAEGGDFSVGADLGQPRFQGHEESDRPSPTLLMRRRGAELGAALMRSLQEIPQPTIAAVQGVATNVARTPVKNELVRPSPCASLLPKEPKCPVISKNPDKLRPTMKSIYASSDTTMGSWS